MDNNASNQLDMADLLKLVQQNLHTEVIADIEPKQLRYALYVRKSTENEDRQARSIPDQIKDCFESVIEPSGIILNPRTDIFKEEKSAKEAGTRPVFRKMLDLIQDGTYDAVIAWHPDRLSRNMKDAGELIDLIDRNVIKDLKFARAHFENTPNGKMMLGISFVLSKHYSEHLSESVNRGNRRGTESGRIVKHAAIHGYRLTEDRHLLADDHNYLLIEKAFQMRQANTQLKEIADFLNTSGYQQYRHGKGHLPYKFDVDAVSKMLRDPIYAGILVYGKVATRLSDTDPDFSPMITEEAFLNMHKGKDLLGYGFKFSRAAPSDTSDLLRKCVICADCSRTMTTSVIVKRDKNNEKKPYFRFRCETPSCPMKGSGPRGAVVVDYATKFLETHLFNTRANYERYRQDAKQAIEADNARLRSSIQSLRILVGKKQKEYEGSMALAADKDNSYSQHYTPEHLDRLKSELESYQQQLADDQQKLDQLSGTIESYDEFLELYENVADLLRYTTGLSAKDEILRTFFLNFTVKGEPAPPNYKQKQWSVIDHCLAEPFKTFVENGEFSNGRG